MARRTTRGARGVLNNDMKEYNVGDVVWWATYERHAIREDCPVCFAKRRVQVILGNDEIIEVDCDYCGKGWERARGFIEEIYDYESKVRQTTVDKKEVTEGSEGRECRYQTHHMGGNYTLDAEDIFDTKEEADARLVEKIAKANAEEAKRIASHKEHSNKSYGWHVGYHRNRATRARKDLEYHEAKASAMKKLAKPTPLTANRERI